MLNAKSLCSPAQISHSITYTKIIWQYGLRLSYDKCMKILQTSYYSKEAFYKTPLDPKIEKLQNLILYSDYIEKHKYKLGYKKNKMIQYYQKYREKHEKENEMLNNPVISVALKYLGEIQDVNKTKDCIEKSSMKPIYMPYASEDKFENIQVKEKEEEQNNKENINMNLNESYKIQYEEFLKKSSNKEKTMHTQWRDNMKSIPPDWMTDYEIYDETLKKDNDENDNEDSWPMQYGTPEPDSPISSIPCGGCGALLHCKDPAIPGYLPSELFIYRREEELRTFICQRCHFMKSYNVSLDVKVSADEYPKLLQTIKGKRVAVILMVDLMDFPCSIWSDLPSIIGKHATIFLVGNKVDLLPQDSIHFFKHIKECLVKATVESGIDKKNIKHVALISAKTNFGIEELINNLWNLWEYKGHVYLIGCTNVGKSSLFNALLQSDFCKVKAVDLVQRATISPWPGTTLNLLKFPILKPDNQRKYERTKRLIAEREQRAMEREHKKLQYITSKKLEFSTLQSRIGRTFMNEKKGNYQKMEDIFLMNNNIKQEVDEKMLGLDETQFAYKYSKWCYDTPGTIQPNQILHFLTTEELLNTLPKKIISPRTFIFKPNQTLFLAGLGRLDYLDGPDFIRCTVFASDELPVTICKLENANVVYNELLQTKAFVVPVNDPERLKLWPEMQSKEFVVNGINKSESAGDIVLSSAGWVSVTPHEYEKVFLRAWTPEGRGIYFRTPALLKKAVALRGARIYGNPTYKKGRIVFGY